MTVKVISVVINLTKPIASEVFKKLILLAESYNITLQLDKVSAKKMGYKKLGVDKNKFLNCDIAIVVGGDGTFLSATHIFYKKQIPLIGIHIGSLGFLTEFKINEINKMMKYILKNKFEIEDRMMLAITVKRGKRKINEFIGINEAVISKGGLTRIIKLKSFVNDKYAGTFTGDGLMVCTPTGSTAYSLSAGGPIVVPMTDVLILNMMCPHTFGVRPIVIPGSSTVTIEVISDFKDIILTIDGHIGNTLKVGDKIIIKKSDYFLRVVHSPNRNFFDILREKFNWVS